MLGVMSLFFWKERQAYDTAHYLLELIIRKNFFIAHQRPAGIVSQILPLAGIYLGLPLEWLMKLYSLGDILFYFLIFLFLSKYARDYRGALTLLLSYMLAVGFSFYCPVTELMQGIALLPLLWVLFESTIRLRYPVVLMLMAFIIFSHPLLFIPTGIMIGWRWFQENAEKKDTLIMLGGFIIISGFKLLLLDKYDYQKTYYPVVFNDYSNLRNLKDFAYQVSFLRLIIKGYPVTMLMFLITLLSLVFRKKMLAGIYLLVSVAVFLLIMVATHRFVEITNYSERMLLPLTFIVAFPFSLELFRINNSAIRNLLLSGILLFLVFRLHAIGTLSMDYTLRINMMENLIDASHKAGHQKVIADENYLEQVPTAGSGWCYSIETMLFSALDGPEQTVSIAMQHDHIDRIREAGITLQSGQWIKWMEYILQDDTLPARYFKFKPQVYLPLRNDGSVDSAILSNLKCKFDKPVEYSREKHQILTLRFEGLKGMIIPAKTVEIRLSHQNQIQMFQLNSDIYDGYKQQIFVQSPVPARYLEEKDFRVIEIEKSPAQ